ncbi:methylated-DNA--[protein]-cysteine S-methyltransferase [Rubritalea spongiae]|uniref:Methylated-DNA--protein-cysteine methyltransferase n=1 Tax=Rubritalea spongiae TaxID=430797 RepID=A0ABW5E4W9_9BACT
MHIEYTHYQSPIGTLRLRAHETGLVAVDHANQQAHTDPQWQKNANHPILKLATRELQSYFDGTLTHFHTPLTPTGTPFQLRVWNALLEIPYGQTASYSDIAQELNNPKAVRAIGAANGRNPLSIFIPCHRIIGKNGSLTGYAGGTTNKEFLLRLENKHHSSPLELS